ncbi:hypothetical protein B0T22DRAFT_268460 [Podospora appendiculata]|uniref:serine--tRNA ligase n=1 Tax=Podospora appendiculata TaxID=314037 RepID=A0AAE0X3H0_9PEZI|nr:hypothetical protein B0T22DRAFT_268460 [Podospora appendiculata]
MIMMNPRSVARPFTCLQCLSLVRKRAPLAPRSIASPSPSLRLPKSVRAASYHSTRTLQQSSTTSPEQHQPLLVTPPRTTTAPRPTIDIKHIRNNAELYAQNCRDRNYPAAAAYPARIVELFAKWHDKQREARGLRRRANMLRRHITDPEATRDDADADTNEEAARLRSLSREQLLEEAREVKAKLSVIQEVEDQLTTEIDALALALPNLTHEAAPRGEEPRVLSYINDHPEPEPALSDRVWRSHVHIGSELGLLDFAGAAKATGWGWYYLLDEAAQLEQALVSYALKTATLAGWRQVSPPSMVYSHITAACGFQPRDANGETQIYHVAQSDEDAARGKPSRCLAGTAEIPLAGMKADTILDEGSLPLKRVAVSRCYRAEAGSRGLETKGLYRVHEFTKVEMFAWTAPNAEAAEDLFDEMVDLQTEMLGSLGLHCRVLEMPTADLGASSSRKCDIEAYFPSRRELRNEGWGEVTSASICTDYQTRRLATRIPVAGKQVFPWTINGTALAVPRVLAAILENGWDEDDMSVKIPEVLRPWMDGRDKIGPKRRV